MLDKLKLELAGIIEKMAKIDGVKDYTDRLTSSFHLGRVGGSGRNTYRLNKKRERCLESTIDRAKKWVELDKRRNFLETEIKDIESGARQAREDKKTAALPKLALYWQGLKVGDFIDIGGNSPAQITKKNAKSIETGSGCKWTAAEIIGKKAAAFL